MQKTCPSCGAETFPGTRFCRRCGASVRDELQGTGDVSPQAATVPLDGGEAEGRATEGLAPAGERAGAQTSRVSLAEMERLLRAQSEAAARPGQAPPPDTEVKPVIPQPAHASAVTRPDTAGDREELTITVPRPAPTHETGGFETTSDFDATRPADFDATRPADFDATRPSAYDPTRPTAAHAESQQALSDAPASEVEARADAAHGAAGPDAEAPRAAPGVAASRVRGAERLRAWAPVVTVCAAVLVLAAGGAWLALKLLRRPAVTDVPTQGPSAPSVNSDAPQEYERKLADAEALLAAGNMDGAVARLREAAGLDPANPRAHRRLAELLISTGARREAIEELRAVVRAEPEDAGAWRQLASAQFAEGLYHDASESYRRLVALAGQQTADPADLLAYADALRLSGRAEESRAVYESLTSAAAPDIAAAARQHLAELSAAQPTATPTPRAGEQPVAPPVREGETVAVNATPAPTAAAATPTPATPPDPQPAPAPPTVSPAEHYGRGQQLWSSNRGAALSEFRSAAAGGNYDAHYYLGLSYVEGKRLGSLQRAEVVAALQHFQLAQRGRQYAAESRRYEQQLEKEFDRLRRQ